VFEATLNRVVIDALAWWRCLTKRRQRKLMNDEREFETTSPDIPFERQRNLN